MNDIIEEGIYFNPENGQTFKYKGKQTIWRKAKNQLF